MQIVEEEEEEEEEEDSYVCHMFLVSRQFL